MTQILVMGGAGYIGSHTVKHLLDNGYEVVVADNLVYGHEEAVDSRAKFILADLADAQSLKNIFIQYKIDAVIHFAAFTYVGESVSNPQKYYQNNVVGTTAIFKSIFITLNNCAKSGWFALILSDKFEILIPYGNVKTRNIIKII